MSVDWQSLGVVAFLAAVELHASIILTHPTSYFSFNGA